MWRMLSLKIRVSEIAQGEGPGGPCPSRALFVRNHKYRNRCIFTITTNFKNLSPYPHYWFVNHPSSPIGNYLPSLGMNSSYNPPLGDHPGVASKNPLPPFQEPGCLSLLEMRAFRSPKGRQIPERNITWNAWIVTAMLLKKSKNERSNAWNVAVLSLWFCAVLKKRHHLHLL